MIELVDVHKHFGKVHALRGVTWRADDGVITGVLGPNGAGKTTSLRVASGLLPTDAGAARVDGVTATGAPATKESALAIRRSVGALPHAHGLYPRLTPREHIRYFGQLHGVDDKTISARTERLIELLDMREFVDRRTDGFSQGQKLKTAIARMLVHEPKNVILDEPTAGLDVKGTRAMRDLIRALKADGRCVVFSSHVMQEVAALCDRVVVIAQGRVAVQGTPDELLASTGKTSLEDAFVAAIGSEEGLA